MSDSPKGSDRLRRRPLATAVVEVLKTIEGPETSIACSLYGGWGSGKTQFTNILVDEMKSTLEEKKYPTLKPPLPFIWMCNVVGKCCCCFDHAPESYGNENNKETVNVSENNFLCCLYCCCGFLILPIYLSASYVNNCFKSGKN